MKSVTFLEREAPWERHERPIVPVESESHRPRKRFRVRLETLEDIQRARQQGVPLLLVQSEDLRILHYPLRIPPTIVVPREYRDVLDTEIPVRVFHSLTPFTQPRIEDLVVFLLLHDPLAARAVVDRNRDLLDLAHLTKRIYQEDLEAPATLVHLQDFVNIPAAGEPLPREGLLRALEGNRVTEVLP